MSERDDKNDEPKAFHEWWRTQGMQGEEHAVYRWCAWNGWFARSQFAQSAIQEQEPAAWLELDGDEVIGVSRHKKPHSPFRWVPVYRSDRTGS